MPVQIVTNIGAKRTCTLKAGSAARKPGQAVKEATRPQVGSASWILEPTGVAGVADGVLFQVPGGYTELTDSNGSGYYLPIHSGGEQRLLSGGAVAINDPVRPDADGKWVKAMAGQSGQFFRALEATTGADQSFGARPLQACELI